MNRPFRPPVIFEKKSDWTHLIVEEIEGGFRYRLTGNDAGTGRRRTYADRNKYRVQNAGRKAQAEMEGELADRRLRKASFR